MTGKPWSQTTTVFTIRGQQFRVVPFSLGGVTLQQWSAAERAWVRLGAFPTRREARAYAATVASS